MSILDKELRPIPRRRSRRRLYISLGIVIVLLAILLIFTNIGNDIGFVAHFVTPPQHFAYSGHSDYISAVAWSPDGKRIASASGDHTAQVWDASNGGHVLTYRGHSSDVLTLAWSPNGQYIATGSLDTTVQVWNAVTGAMLYTYRGHSDAIFDLAWSPDSKRIASVSSDNTIQVWDALTGQNVVTYRNTAPIRGGSNASNAVAWSADGQTLAVGGIGPAMLLNATTAQVVGYLGPNGGESHAVAFSPDGRYLAIGRDDSTVEVWNLATKSKVYTYSGHSADVFTVGWSPDSKRIASGGRDATVQVWDALTGGHEYTYRGHLDYYWGHFTSAQEVDTLAWSPDGTHIASGGADNTVQVWQPQ